MNDFAGWNAARLLREVAAEPRKGVIWPLYHHDWWPEMIEAWNRAIIVLAGRGDERAKLIEVIRDMPDETTTIVIWSGEWPWSEAPLAMLDAADLIYEGATT